MSWRPEEGWKTPNVIALKDVKAGFVKADQVRFLAEEECKAYEAGADAMFTALVEWLDGKCRGHHIEDGTDIAVGLLDGKIPVGKERLRRHCSLCWQALKKED